MLTASNGKGHGIHSPFVFDFVKNVLNDTSQYGCYHQIEQLRAGLLKDETIISIEDFGAGSSVIKTNERSVKQIATLSLKNKKFAQLLYRIVNYYKPENIIELGTSLGITTAYFSYGNQEAEISTLEGSKNIAAVAQNNFDKLNLKNIKIVQGNFDDTLPGVLSQIKIVDLAFVDGNHRQVPTLQYFDQILKKSNEHTILIFDDIHWSEEMEEAWKEIQQHPSVTLSIDLFFIGLVFFKKDFKAKQHFTIRF